MPNVVLSPNMNLPVPVVGVDPGPDWALNINSSLSIIDQHNHSSGSGVQIQPSGLNINSNLTFQNNQANNLQAVAFLSQSSLATLKALYVIGVDLYYRDGSNNQIQITSGGSVNATASGIASGTATASFVSSVLVVNASPNKPANIQGASLLLGNNVAFSHYLTLSPPNAMGADYSLVLPSIPGSTSFLQIDTSGNITAGPTIAGGLTSSNLSSSAGIVGGQIASATITGGNVAAATLTGSNIAAATLAGSNMISGTVTGTQIQTNVALNGSSVSAGSKNVAVSNTNTTNSLAIIRGGVSAAGSLGTGEGFSVNRFATGSYTITFSTAFADTPACIATANNTTPRFISSAGTLASAVNFFVYDTTGTLVNDSFDIHIIGQRA